MSDARDQRRFNGVPSKYWNRIQQNRNLRGVSNTQKVLRFSFNGHQRFEITRRPYERVIVAESSSTSRVRDRFRCRFGAGSRDQYFPGRSGRFRGLPYSVNFVPPKQDRLARRAIQNAAV